MTETTASSSASASSGSTPRIALNEPPRSANSMVTCFRSPFVELGSTGPSRFDAGPASDDRTEAADCGNVTPHPPQYTASRAFMAPQVEQRRASHAPQREQLVPSPIASFPQLEQCTSPSRHEILG